MILYDKNFKVIGTGNILENSTHYIIDTTYYDKKTCYKADVELPIGFDVDKYLYNGEKFVKINPKIVTKNEFFKLLGIELLTQLLQLSKTDIQIETFKFWLEGCDNGISLEDEVLIQGLNYLVLQGYITQEKCDSILT